MEPITKDTLPPSASMSGKNTVYIHCDHIGRRSSYGVCLFTIKAFEEGRLSDLSECASCIQNGCSAMKMRSQELEAGRALFFKERTAAPVIPADDSKPARVINGPTQPHNPNYMRGWDAVGGESPTKSKRPAKTPPKPAQTASEKMFGVKAPTLQEAVNVAARESTLGSEKQPTPLVQYVAKLIRSKDREAWRSGMLAIIKTFRLDKDGQTRLVQKAKALAESKHPLDNAFIPKLETA